MRERPEFHSFIQILNKYLLFFDFLSYLVIFADDTTVKSEFRTSGNCLPIGKAEINQIQLIKIQLHLTLQAG